MPIDALNIILGGIKNANIFGWKPFDWIQLIPVPEIPMIPMLAQGGVLKKGQMALLEGQGDEAVIPLSQNTEWIDKVADKLSAKQQQYNITINIDKMGQTSEDDIEEFAEQLMEIMAQKSIRREYAMV